VPELISARAGAGFYQAVVGPFGCLRGSSRAGIF